MRRSLSLLVSCGKALLVAWMLLYLSEYFGWRVVAEADGEVPFRVVCSNAFKAVMEELAPRFEQTSKHRLAITYGVSTVLKRRLDAGEPFDLAVLTPPLIDDLIAQGRIAPDTRTVLARSAMAFATRTGAPKSDIHTADLLKRTLLGAKSIAYAREGASAVLFNQLVDRLGITEDLNPKIVLTTTGENVRAAIARGDAEIGVLPLSEIVPFPGVGVLGTFPDELAAHVVMAAGARPGGEEGQAARKFMQFLLSPDALRVIRKNGMERG